MLFDTLVIFSPTILVAAFLIYRHMTAPTIIVPKQEDFALRHEPVLTRTPVDLKPEPTISRTGMASATSDDLVQTVLREHAMASIPGQTRNHLSHPTITDDKKSAPTQKAPKAQSEPEDMFYVTFTEEFKRSKAENETPSKAE
ncbi:hypothetical protein ACOI1H_16300 [Loktanella sp. DJP18]|uniref:hypothetical protein n=1 Tax=Loktanella sp. DJP18 TaxID=3409788 RepID=UPI003BB7AFF4